MLYLQKVLLIYLKECVFFITYELKLPLRVSFKNACLLDMPMHKPLHAQLIVVKCKKSTTMFPSKSYQTHTKVLSKLPEPSAPLGRLAGKAYERPQV